MLTGGSDLHTHSTAVKSTLEKIQVLGNLSEMFFMKMITADGREACCQICIPAGLCYLQPVQAVL
jgi:hypothetical protein